jgi:hypothetical protein
VQYYNPTDPANTYGNANFTAMFSFLNTSLTSGHQVVYHPETAYWINFDVAVPLFLPLYAYGRVSDLRSIASLEKQQGATMQGQMNFDSGWEWGQPAPLTPLAGLLNLPSCPGRTRAPPTPHATPFPFAFPDRHRSLGDTTTGYWLQDVITARAAWGVCLPGKMGSIFLEFWGRFFPFQRVAEMVAENGCATDMDALSVALLPVTRAFGPLQSQLHDLLLSYIDAQRNLLIFGRASGDVPRRPLDTDYIKLNGQAYLQGWDTYSELPALLDPEDSVQPVKLGFDAIWLNQGPDYWSQARGAVLGAGGREGVTIGAGDGDGVGARG